MVGTFASGALSKRFGNKNILFLSELSNLIFILLTILSFFSKNMNVFLMSRFFIGFTEGGSKTCWNRLVIECWPKYQRGIGGVIYNVFKSIGNLVAYSAVNRFKKTEDGEHFLFNYWVPIMIWASVVSF